MAKSRYLYSPKTKANNKEIYDNMQYPIIDQLANDNYIITNVSTRLDLLAHEYYGDSELYWIIAVCNNIYGTLFTEPGLQLCVPNRNRISDIFAKLESLNKGN